MSYNTAKVFILICMISELCVNACQLPIFSIHCPMQSYFTIFQLVWMWPDLYRKFILLNITLLIVLLIILGLTSNCDIHNTTFWICFFFFLLKFYQTQSQKHSMHVRAIVICSFFDEIYSPHIKILQSNARNIQTIFFCSSEWKW